MAGSDARATPKPWGHPHTRPMDFTGRPMIGYVVINTAGCSTDDTQA
jgi:hypothetical protein